MIGPHTGRELELMLTGKKPAAMFCDALPEAGHISEAIIPEKAFLPYVSNGTFVRISKIFLNKLTRQSIKYVSFAPPAEQWRIECLMRIQEGAYSGSRPETETTPVFIGRLLGYSETDIQDFMKNKVTQNEIHPLVA